MYTQTANLPVVFQVNEGIIDQIPQFLKTSKLEFRNVVVVSGTHLSVKYAGLVLDTIDAKHYTVTHCDLQTVEALKDYCDVNNFDLLIGVGGGSVLDTVKRVSLLTGVENILVPTIISNDGLISPISVVKDENGRTASLAGKMPVGIVVDIDIIRQAPTKFLLAAAGDILSNISATNDWVLANVHANEPINDLAYMLSRSAALALIHHESKNINNRNFLKQVVACQINSGLAMALAGNSRPCSGSEHLISHAIDFKNLSEDTLHGLQVGSVSIFCLYLQNKLDTKCLNYAFELEIPYAFDTLDSKLYGELKGIYEMALQMRPGRFTVLDLCTNKPFDDLYDEFIAFLKRFKSY